jgi:integrase
MATPKHVVSPNAPRIDPSQAMFSMAKIDHDVPVEFKDNETILLTWASEFEHRLRPSTLRAYAYEIRRFMETWGEVLVTSISGSQFRAYLRRFERLCKHLTRRNPPFGESREQHPRWCLKDLPLAQCGTACPGYDPVSRDVIIHHLDALNCLFQYLGELEVVRNNWPREIRKSLANGRHRDKWSRAKHNLTRMEVQRLLNLAPHRQRRTIYAILAKTGIRYSELVHLTIDPSHYNPGEGWIRVPEFGGKRLGNRLLVVDAILATILTHYMDLTIGFL